MMPESKPRYTVELTTEGWQIKDSEAPHYTADVFGDREAAQEVADSFNRMQINR